MKPKTDVQKQVYRLAKSLPKITEKQKEWARMSILRHYAYITKKFCCCMECGHKWETPKYESDLFVSIMGIKCPQCDMSLQRYPGRQRTGHDVKMFNIIQKHRGFQVVRIFRLIRNIKSQEAAKYTYHEIIQHWIDPEGKVVIRAVYVSGGWTPYWSFGKMEIRSGKQDKYYQNCNYSYPRKSFIPELIRNGYVNDNKITLHPSYLFEMLLTDPKIETLFKAGQHSLINKFAGEDELTEYWPQVKMALRRNIFIDDSQMWFDHFDLLKKFNRDLHSPKYIFPDDLSAEHNRLNKRLKDIRRKNKIIELEAEMEADNIFYKARCEKYFDLKYVVGGIIIEPLRSVEEFIAEGDDLGHCLFNSGYHNKEMSLIFSSKLNGERLETAEFSLETFKVTQCHGLDNEDSDYHEVIIEALNRAAPDIYARTHPKETLERLNLTPTEVDQYPLIV